MSLNIEMSELIKNTGSSLYEIAEKVEYKQNLSTEEKEMFEISDAWAREVGNKGCDPNKEIASFVTKTVQEELYNAPDELLDTIFTRGTIGEFDDAEYQKQVKNTLTAYNAAKGGTVDRSFLDFTVIKPEVRNSQIETDLSYADMRRNGFKSIATLATYCQEALKNKMFFDIFNILDDAIVGGDQVIIIGGGKPTQEGVDQMTQYLLDRDSNASIIGLSKYTRPLYRMDGRKEYLSNEMKDNFNRYGIVDFIDGVKVATIPAAHKTGRGEMLLPDKRIWGVSGSVGTIDMKGEVHTYQTEDNQNEKMILKVADFTYNFAITNPDNVVKMTFNN